MNEQINRLIALALRAHKAGNNTQAMVYTNCAKRMITAFNIMPPVPKLSR